jgi:hypothetical protein
MNNTLCEKSLEFFKTWPDLVKKLEPLGAYKTKHHARLSRLEAAASHGCPLCSLFLRQLEYISQDIRKHCKAQRAGETGDLVIRAKISWEDNVYGCGEEVYKTIQYDTTVNRGYDFSTREDVTVQLYLFKLENLRGE